MKRKPAMLSSGVFIDNKTGEIYEPSEAVGMDPNGLTYKERNETVEQYSAAFLRSAVLLRSAAERIIKKNKALKLANRMDVATFRRNLANYCATLDEVLNKEKETGVYIISDEIGSIADAVSCICAAKKACSSYVLWYGRVIHPAKYSDYDLKDEYFMKKLNENGLLSKKQKFLLSHYSYDVSKSLFKTVSDRAKNNNLIIIFPK
ncbi:MAG: hypothetical protein K6E63_04410 [Lachnospiraceae bacterium]|nr:hypothetical protein [Lachnospiraceae bacterium]